MRPFFSRFALAATSAVTASVLVLASPTAAWFDGPAIQTRMNGDLTDSQWALDAIDARAAWTVSRGEGVLVAVIDSGVSASPEFAGRLQPAFSVRAGAVEATAARDDVGHGTHVAGIIAAAADGTGVTGVAPDARVLSISVDSDASSRGIAAAVTHAVASGARVMNLSLGVEKDDGLCAAVAAADEAGVLVVAAAGNDGDAGNLPQYPSACPHALSVSALTARLTPATFTSFDANVALAAPGVDVLSVLPPTSQIAAEEEAYFGVAEMSGTSQAAPVVAGIAALLFAAEPQLSPTEARQRLISTAHDLGPSGWDAHTGHGLPSAARALGVTASLPVVRHVSAKLMNTSRGLFSRPSKRWSLGWEPPAPLPTRYVLHRHGSTGTSSVTIDRTAVRFDAGVVAPGEWFELVAEYPDRNVSSFPAGLADYSTNEPQGVRIRRTALDTIVVSFTVTRAAEQWMVGLITRDGFPVLVREGGSLEANQRQVVRIKLPVRRDPQLNAESLSASVVVFSNGEPSEAESRRLPALNVLTFDSAARLTGSTVRVVGTAVNGAVRDCNRARKRRLCVGDAISVRAGGQVFTTRLDATGTFVVTIRTPAAATKVTVSAYARRDPRLNSAAGVKLGIVR